MSLRAALLALSFDLIVTAGHDGFYAPEVALHVTQHTVAVEAATAPWLYSLQTWTGGFERVSTGNNDLDQLLWGIWIILGFPLVLTVLFTFPIIYSCAFVLGILRIVLLQIV